MAEQPAQHHHDKTPVNPQPRARRQPRTHKPFLVVTALTGTLLSTLGIIGPTGAAIPHLPTTIPMATPTATPTAIPVARTSALQSGIATRIGQQTPEQVADLCSQTPLPNPDWILKTYGGPTPQNLAKTLGINEPVRLVIIDEGPPKLLPTFGPITVIPESTKVATDTTHIRTMLGLAAAENQGVARIPGIEIQAVTVHSVDDETAYERAVAGILTRAGVTKTGTVTGPPQRIAVAMPVSFGGLFNRPDIRTLLKAGLKSGRILWFGAGGNRDDTSVPKPGSYEEVVGVAATTQAGTAVTGVPSGNALDIGAPGDCQITPNDTGGLSLSYGSSGAVVIAAAFAARVWVANPTLHATQVRQILESSTAQKNKTTTTGWGLTNLNLIPPDTTPPTITFKKISATKVQIRVIDGPSPQPPGLPQSGVIVGYSTNPGNQNPKMLPPTKPTSAAFLTTSDPCRQYCATIDVAPGQQITVTAIDSPTYQTLNGTWTGEPPSTLTKDTQYASAVWPAAPPKNTNNTTKPLDLTNLPANTTNTTKTNTPATTPATPTTTLPTKAVGKLLGSDYGGVITYRDVGSTNRKTLVEGKNGGSVSAWSPDNKTIAFESERSNHSEIYLMNADGTNQRQLTTTLPSSPGYPFFGAFNVTWSPDGQTLMYSSLFDGIYALSPDKTNLRKIVGDKTMHVSYPTWSPDGTTIAYSRSIPGRQNDIWTMNPDGTNQQQLTTDPADERFPQWSPDSKQLSFAVGQSRGRVNRDGTNRTMDVAGYYGQSCSLWATGGCGEPTK
jgi:Subtilase family/WD40-like Beta Propeller Repeat